MNFASAIPVPKALARHGISRYITLESGDGTSRGLAGDGRDSAGNGRRIKAPLSVKLWCNNA